MDGEYTKENIEKLKCDRAKCEELRDELYRMIDEQYNYPTFILEKAKSLLGLLKNYSPSLREKISVVVDMCFNESKKITQIIGHDKAGINFYSRDEFNDMIGKFVKIRNMGAHVGIEWSEGIQIFPHLKLYVYYSILKRAGYDMEESTNILRYFLSRFF